MAVGEVYQKILEHLKKDGPLNTFRLARDLNLDRYKLLGFIEKLEKAGAVEVQHGAVEFLKFPSEEKKIVSKPEIDLEIKKLEQKIKAPKVIRRIIVKKVPVIKKVYVKSKKLEEQAEQIAKLEKTIKELERKARSRPKTMTRTVTKTIIKKVPVPSTIAPHSPQKNRKKSKKKKKSKRTKKIFKKFKFLKFNFMKSIKQLKKPEFAKK